MPLPPRSADEKTSANKPSVGIISDFESAPVSSRFGLGWTPSTDAIAGGRSTASMTRVRASGRSGWALSVRGEVVGDLPFAWSGVMFNPGDRLFSPADLSSGKELVFACRGDEKTYTVLLFTQKRGRIPSRHTFVAKKEWSLHRVLFSAFDGADGSDVVGIAFVAGPKPQSYALELDDVELR